MAKALSDNPIKRRKVAYIEDGGIIRFPGWAFTVTSLGSCVEPFLIDNRFFTDTTNTSDFDPSDPMTRIDELKSVPDGDVIMVDGDGTVIHGGDYLPRVFIKTGNYV